MKLTLTITCPTYELARSLLNYLAQVGFAVHVCSPLNGIYEVVVSWSWESPNSSTSIRLPVDGREIENAARLAKDYLLDHQ